MTVTHFPTSGELPGELDFSQNLISLTAYNVTGCRGQIHNGDNFVWQVMAFPRTTAGMANTITSP